MNILVSLTYYKPYVSGLTIYAQRIAEELARRGHNITVLTSKTSGQAKEENLCGVNVVRIPAMLKLSKGLIMPQMVVASWRMLKNADILHLHLPQFDSFYLALFAKIRKVPLVVTYQCDLDLPKGFMNRIVNLITNTISRFTVTLADLVVTTSLDYAQHSKVLQKKMYKIQPCLTPIETQDISSSEKLAFLTKFSISDQYPIIGMAGRLATEKGMEIMIAAFKIIQKQYPYALFIHAGNSSNVLGEEAYRDYIFTQTKKFEHQWRFLGKLSDAELTAFYQICDVLAFPSLNSTEAFGMVQIEAMLQGTPVVASDLPGSRQPVKITGMGKIVPLKNSEALAEGILDVLQKPENYTGNLSEIRRKFSSSTSADFYQTQFQDLIDAKK